MMKLIVALIIATGALISCSKQNISSTDDPKLIVKLVANPNQQRLGNAGTPVSIPAGHAGQDPVFNGIAAHYLELAPSAYTRIGSGTIVYHAAETSAGGANAIDFSKSVIKRSGDTYLEIPLKNITPGEYEWVRLSLSYQNYDVQFYYGGQPFTGTVASFVGFNSYISSFPVKAQTVAVNSNKKQGFWAFETAIGVTTGQSAEGATTVPNPLIASSPIPAGSCVVTGQFANKLLITANETKNIIVTMNLSVNKSFEWKDVNGNGKWDVDNGSGETVVDMGLRGLIPAWQKN